MEYFIIAYCERSHHRRLQISTPLGTPYSSDARTASTAATRRTVLPTHSVLAVVYPLVLLILPVLAAFMPQVLHILTTRLRNVLDSPVYSRDIACTGSFCAILREAIPQVAVGELKTFFIHSRDDNPTCSDWISRTHLTLVARYIFALHYVRMRFGAKASRAYE